MKKINIARKNGFKFNLLKKHTIKFYAKQSQMTIRYYLKHRIPKMHRIKNTYKTFVLIQIIHFVLQVVNGPTISIRNDDIVYLRLFNYEKQYNSDLLTYRWLLR